jgi:hypothetical protein
MDLNSLLARPNVTLKELQDYLASLSGADRVAQGTSVKAGLQKTLWTLAEGAEHLKKSDIVPEGTPALEPVRFEGINSLPLYRRFAKVFYRTGDGRIAGYNDSSASWLSGPGYYILNEDAQKGLFVDYTQLPADKPAGWPAIVSNDKGMSQFIYGNMHDYLRRVYDKILIGRAYKFGKETPNYFTLSHP